MSIRNDACAAASALVYGQYALCHIATDLTAALRDLRWLRRTTNHPSAALDPVIARIRRVRDEVRDEITGIDELLDPRRASGELVGA
jgi:hypothetical protein